MPGRQRGRSLEAALAPSFAAEPVPTEAAALVRYAGGRRELTRQLSGMDGPPPTSLRSRDPERYERERTRWRTASRRAQRWDTEGKEGKQRRATPQVAESEARTLRRVASERKRVAARHNGLRARLYARVRISSPKAKRGGDERDREMPAGGPGVYIDRDTVAEVLDALRDDREAAAEDFLAAFWESYGMPPEAEIVAVYRLKIWPEGRREPA